MENLLKIFVEVDETWKKECSAIFAVMMSEGAAGQQKVSCPVLGNNVSKKFTQNLEEFLFATKHYVRFNRWFDTQMIVDQNSGALIEASRASYADILYEEKMDLSLEDFVNLVVSNGQNRWSEASRGCRLSQECLKQLEQTFRRIKFDCPCPTCSPLMWKVKRVFSECVVLD